MAGADDPLDRLHGDVLALYPGAPGAKRPRGDHSLRAAAAAAQPLSIDSPAALVEPAPDSAPGFDELARRAFTRLHALLLTHGVDGATATAQAQRAVEALLLEVVDGHDQVEAARRLGVTDRTLRSDRAVLRTIDREELFA